MRKIITILTVLVISSISLSACSTVPSPPEAAFSFTTLEASENYSPKKIKKLKRKVDRAWGRVIKRTQVQYITNDRIRVETESGFTLGRENAEQALLIRAAAETLKAGYDGFIIRYLSYETKFPFSLADSINTFPEDIDIRTYEEFLTYSEEQTMFVSGAGQGFQSVTSVIQFIKAEGASQGRYFPAQEVYKNLMESYVLPQF